MRETKQEKVTIAAELDDFLKVLVIMDDSSEPTTVVPSSTEEKKETTETTYVISHYCISIASNLY